MKKLFTSIITLVLVFSMVGSVVAEGIKVDYEYSNILVQAVQLDEVFVGTVGTDGDVIVLDQHKASKNGISSDQIKEAEEKIKEYNKITEDALAISPFITLGENKIHFDDKAAKKMAYRMNL